MKMGNLKSKIGMFAAILVLVVTSCSDDKDDNNDQSMTTELTLEFLRLDDLGPDYLYEGWIIVDDEPISTGTFSVDLTGVASQAKFTIDSEMLSKATKFVLSIEPSPDSSPLPSNTKIFTGDFNGNVAVLNTTTIASFSDVSGKFIIGAPTGTGAEEQKYSGIWFLDNSSGNAVAGLELPVLMEGWKYEGWVALEGKILSTGMFTSTSGADEAAPYSGANPGPAFPGEDFLENAPEGIEFPEDLRGRFVVISVEPFPDNSPRQFTLKPLFARIPDDATGVQTLGINVVTSFPTGIATRSDRFKLN